MSGRLTVWGASQLLTAYFAGTAEPPPSFWLALVRTTPPTPYMYGQRAGRAGRRGRLRPDRDPQRHR